MLSFFTTHGRMSDPGRHGDIYEALPYDVSSLVDTVQGLLVHRLLATFHGIDEAQLSERKEEEQYSSVEDVLSLMKRLDPSPLTDKREASRKVLVNCRHFAGLLCSFLRHRGFPARVRVGFAGYVMPPPIYGSHYVTEYWDATQGRWVTVDGQVDSVQRRVYQITVDTLDLSSDAFLSGGQTWQLCRIGQRKAEIFGLGPNDNGWGFVKSHLLHDWMALNKMPLLPWHGNDFMHKPMKETTEDERALLDGAADLICRSDDGFEEMRSLYATVTQLNIPQDWQAPTPEALTQQ